MKTLLALLVATQVAGALHAQAPLRATIHAGPNWYWSRSRTAAGGETTTGVGLGVGGSVGWGPLQLQVSYAEAVLGSDTPGVAERTLVEGEVMAGVQPVQWLAFWAGPHARTYALAGGDERWLLWEVRAQARATLLPNRMYSSLTAWGVADGRVDVPEPWGDGRGAEGGLSLRVWGPLMWAHFTYRVEQTRLGDGSRRQTVEMASLRVSAHFPP